MAKGKKRVKVFESLAGCKEGMTFSERVDAQLDYWINWRLEFKKKQQAKREAKKAKFKAKSEAAKRKSEAV